MTFKQALKILAHVEESGTGFWSRNSDDSITIWVRGAHGNDPNQWHNARQIETSFLGRAFDGIVPDLQSGLLRIRIHAKDWYSKGKGE